MGGTAAHAAPQAAEDPTIKYEVYALHNRTAFPPSRGVSDHGVMADRTGDACTEDIRAYAVKIEDGAVLLKE